ncbi:MAG: hypothetical protein KAY32_16210 [Candidatus Eisenbacteria sp.]|nr:hypothetical protein [Candidatus Eisenbacteria bacterium]
MRKLRAGGLLLGLLILAGSLGLPAFGATDLDLSNRIQIDGFSADFADSEAVFFLNEERALLEESTQDSKWGPFNDVNQIKITWDKDFLYVALDGYIGDGDHGNNVILFFDVTNWSPTSSADDGMGGMTELTSWRRNFVFSSDFTPDLFLATWDGNSLPQLWRYATNRDPVLEQIGSDQFSAVATFRQTASRRAMEAAIPWGILFFEQSEQVASETLRADVWGVPEGMDTLRFAAVITGGDDGTGGPDSAPDNFSGHVVEGSEQVLIDNFVILPLDGGDAVDHVPDFGIKPRARLGFKRRPPIKGIVFEFEDLVFDSPVVSPEESIPLRFALNMGPKISASQDFRTVKLTARIYDSLGNLVCVLYRDQMRNVLEILSGRRWEEDQWDGRDMRGRMVPGGIYILSVVSGPNLDRYSRAFSVVR